MTTWALSPPVLSFRGTNVCLAKAAGVSSPTSISVSAVVYNLVYASSLEEALELLARGYEPVECSFGGESVVGPLKLDHHGKLSAEEPVSLKAARLAMEGVRIEDFLITGLGDADAIYAILVLSGAILPDMGIARAIADLDGDPIGINRTEGDYLREVVFECHASKELSLQGFLESCKAGVRAFTPGRLSMWESAAARMYEKRRFSRAVNSIREISGPVAFLVNEGVVRDVGHQVAPLFVQYKPSAAVITVSGCTEAGAERMASRSVFDVLGPSGLGRFYPVLDSVLGASGSGGRPDIGGSPRGLKVTEGQARQVYRALVECCAQPERE